ncbi:MAG: hypothetical protein HEQ23_00110 [Tepidisphaera sp.]
MRQRTSESRLATLRGSRSLPPSAGTVAELIRKQMAEIRALARGAEQALDAWSRVAPPAIAKLATARPQAKPGKADSGGGSGGGGGGGVLTLTVKSPAARFQVDRWLRGGGLAQLRAADAKIRSVRILSAGETNLGRKA